MCQQYSGEPEGICRYCNCHESSHLLLGLLTPASIYHPSQTAPPVPPMLVLKPPPVLPVLPVLLNKVHTQEERLAIMAKAVSSPVPNKTVVSVASTAMLTNKNTKHANISHNSTAVAAPEPALSIHSSPSSAFFRTCRTFILILACWR